MRRMLFSMFLCLFAAVGISAQTTAFSYQGLLKDNNTPANGSFLMQFKLFDSLGGGGQVGSTLTDLPVTVTSGVFNVKLDFGSNALSGANRWLEIAVKRNAGDSYTTLTPREQLASSPYAVRTLSAAMADDSQKLGGVNASEYVTNSTGGDSFIRNQATLQPTSNFNISGTGTANILAATTKYNIGVDRVLSVGGVANIFAGVGTGESNTTGQRNAFFGYHAGVSNTTGDNNAFFGLFAGRYNSNGTENAYFGSNAGQAATTGSFNAFFGSIAGFNNTGSSNSFFGRSAGFSNTSGNNNAFFGKEAGTSNTTGGSNSFFGFAAGLNNGTGSSNTLIGAGANVGSINLTNATAIGAGAVVSRSDSLVLGNNVNVGIGTASPTSKLEIVGPTDVPADWPTFSMTSTPGNRRFEYSVSSDGKLYLGVIPLDGGGGRTAMVVDMTSTAARVGLGGPATTGFSLGWAVPWTTSNWQAQMDVSNGAAIGWNVNSTGIRFGFGQSNTGFYQFRTNSQFGSTASPPVYDLTISNTGNVGIGITNAGFEPARLLHVNGRARVGTIPLETSTAQVCFNAAGDLLQCGASSLRWKKDISSFRSGLSVIAQLDPISFRWKETGQPDLGLGAEDVAKVAPELALTNEDGEVSGVKYEKLNLLLINAIKELNLQIENQRRQIDALTKLVVRSNRRAEARKEKRQ